MAQDQRKIVVCGKCGLKIAIPPGYENVPGKCGKCGGPVNQPVSGQQRQPVARPQAPSAGKPASQGQQAKPASPQQTPQAPLAKSILDDEPIQLNHSVLDSDSPIQLTNPLLDSDAPIKLDSSFLDSDTGGAKQAGAGGITDEFLDESVAVSARKKVEHRKAKWFDITFDRAARKRFLIASIIYVPLSGVVFSLLFWVLIYVLARMLKADETAKIGGVFGGADVGLVAGIMVGLVWSFIKSVEANLFYSVTFGIVVGLVLALVYHYLEAAFLATPDAEAWQMAFIGFGAGGFFSLAANYFKEWMDEQ